MGWAGLVPPGTFVLICECILFQCVCFTMFVSNSDTHQPFLDRPWQESKGQVLVSAKVFLCTIASTSRGAPQQLRNTSLGPWVE